MKFILDNIFLIAIALVSGGLLLWPLLRKSGGSTSLGSLEATQLINHRNAIVVDVRDEKAFAAGSLAGARNIPFDKLGERAAEVARFKARPVLIVCDAGQQSTRAIATFKAQGFDEAYTLSGGVTAWKAASLPLVVPGRDNAKAIAKDPARKTKEQRSGDRNRGARTAPRAIETAPVVDATPATAEAVAVPETSLPDRVKEPS